MKEFGLSKALQNACTSCCIGNEETENEEMSVYAKAELIICNWKLGRFPQVKEFMDHDAKSFSNLKTSHVRGSPPVLKFTADDGEQETVDIGGWDREALKEYLGERLAK